MDYYLLIYFLAGALQDFMFTLNLKFTAKGSAFPAAAFAFSETVVTMLVLYSILTRLDSERGIISIIAYALGIGLGSFAAVKLKAGSVERH